MKRFTETTKWSKPWFQELPPHIKCLWLYICDHADAAGVWEPNWKAASLFIGKNVTAADLSHFAGRVASLKGGKVLVGSFVEFQYGKLSSDCRAHIPIFRLIEKHRVSIGYQEAMDSLKEQEQETEEEPEPDKDKEPEPPRPEASERKDRGTVEEVTAFCLENGLPASDGVSCFHKWEGNGWKNG